MTPFVAPLNDILFSLHHIAHAPLVAEWDYDFAAEIGKHFAGFAEGEIAPINEIGDQEGCRLENGRVRLPSGCKEMYAAYCNQGWPSLTAPEEFGGQAQNALILAMTSEIFSGANHSMQMVTGLVPGAIRTLMNFGIDAQKARFLPSLASGEMLATMCLSEPAAGSDLSRITCRGVLEEERWNIKGEKIFISGGDQDMSDEILHLVLARTSDNGVKGVSLFLCPSTKMDGTRNTINVARIEEKMGLHASPTCQMLFDGAEAELIGEEGRGLAAMFTMMNHARGDVALQGVAHAARAYQIASAYAADRVQGRMPDGLPARLDQHADVRRMLNVMDRYALFGRAMTHIAFVALERGDQAALVEFLTPLIKVYCTEAGMRSAELGIQVLGGYGFLREYRIEQTYRDARITAIYEGANGIHKRMLATRMAQGPSSDAFEQVLIQEGIDTDVLERWQNIRAQTAKHADPAGMAHLFTQVSIDAMQCVLHKRMSDCVNAHPDPDRIRRVLALDPEPWRGL